MLLGAAFVISLVAHWPAATAKVSAALTPALLIRTVIPGLIGYGLSTSLLLYAFAHTEAGIAAVLGSLSPVLILPMTWVAEGRRPSPQACIAALLSVLGSAIIVLWQDAFGSGDLEDRPESAERRNHSGSVHIIATNFACRGRRVEVRSVEYECPNLATVILHNEIVQLLDQ